MERPFAEVFRENLMFYMSRKGCAKKDLAEYVGVSAPMVTDWSNGKKTPLFDKVDLICRFLGITRSMLVSERNTDLTLEKVTITKNESDLLKSYAVLNMDGKAMVNDYAEMLVMSKRYSKDTKLSAKTHTA